MAYNTNKGPQHVGDIQYEGDPNDTQIDFENDTIALKTNAQQRFIVTGSAITGSTYRLVFKPEELPDAFRITAGSTDNDDNVFRIDTDSLYFHTAAGYKWRIGSDTVAPTHTISVTGDISGSATLQAAGNTTIGGDLAVSGAATYSGATSFTSISASGTLHADGATTIGNTFAATGSITAGTTITAGSGLVGNTLDIGGSDLVITAAGNVSGSGTLYAAGAATFSSTVSSTGSISSSASLIGNVLNIGQSDYLVAADGNVSGSGTLYGAGAATFSSTLAVSGATTMEGQLTVINGIDAEFLGNTTLGNAGGDSVTINAATVNIPNVAAGTDNTVVVYNGSTLLTDEIDSRVWGATLVDASGTPVANQIAVWTDANTAQGLTTLKYDGTTLAITGAISGSGNISGSAFYGDGSNLTGLSAGVSGSSRHYSATGLETSGFLKVTGSSTLVGPITIAGPVSGNATSHWGSAATFGETIATTGSVTAVGLYSTELISGSLGLHVDAPATFGGSVSTTGSVSTAAGISASADLQIVGSGTFSHDVAISGNLGIGVSKPIYDLHVNGAGVTVATIDGGAGSDAYLKLATAGTEKGYLKLGSGGNIVLAQDATGGDLLLKAKPGGSSTTYLTLDGGDTTIVAGVPITAQSVTAVGLYSTEIISGSMGMHIDLPATFGATLNVSGNILTPSNIKSTAGYISASLQVKAQKLVINGIQRIASNGDVYASMLSASQGMHVDNDATFGAIVAITSSLGVGVGAPLTALDVHHDPTGLSDDTGGGDVVKFGTGTLTTGKMYYLHSGSSWEQSDTILAASGGVGLLGIALGSNPAVNGVLVRGFFDAHTYLSGAFAVGQPVYVAAPGFVTTIRPSGSAEIVRQVGYCTTTANVIYFNPSSEYIELI